MRDILSDILSRHVIVSSLEIGAAYLSLIFSLVVSLYLSITYLSIALAVAPCAPLFLVSSVLFTSGLLGLPLVTFFMYSDRVRRYAFAIVLAVVVVILSAFLITILSASTVLSDLMSVFVNKYIVGFHLLVIDVIIMFYFHMLYHEIPGTEDNKKRVIDVVGSVSSLMRFKLGRSGGGFIMIMILLSLTIIAISMIVSFEGIMVLHYRDRVFEIGEAGPGCPTHINLSRSAIGLIGGVLETYIMGRTYVSSTMGATMEFLLDKPIIPTSGGQGTGLAEIDENSLVLARNKLSAIEITIFIAIFSVLVPVSSFYYETLYKLRREVRNFMIEQAGSHIMTLRNHVVVAGYGAMGRAVVEGIFQHAISGVREGAKKEFPITKIWNYNDDRDVVEPTEMALNVVVVDKDYEEWDYRRDDEVFKSLGLQETLITYGRTILVPITGPSITSELIMRKLGVRKADAVVTTFRDPKIETYLDQKAYDLGDPERPIIILRSNSSARYATVTVHDLIGKIHRYYPEYVFTNVILRRMFAEALRLANEAWRQILSLLSSGRIDKNAFIEFRLFPIILGRDKTIYYIIKALYLLYEEFKNHVIELGNGIEMPIASLNDLPKIMGDRIVKRRKVVPLTIPLLRVDNENEPETEIYIDGVLITDDEAFTRTKLEIKVNKLLVQRRPYAAVDYLVVPPNVVLIARRALTLARRVLLNDVTVKSFTYYYRAPIRHRVRMEGPGSRLGSINIPMVVQKPSNYVILSKIAKNVLTAAANGLRQAKSGGTKYEHVIVPLPIFVVNTQVEGETSRISIELIKAITFALREMEELRREDEGIEVNYAVIIPWIYDKEWFRLREYSRFHRDVYKHVRLINLYNLAKEGVSTYLNLTSTSGDERE